MLTDPRLISDRVERRPGRYRLGQRATAHDTLSLGSEADTIKALTLGVGNDVITGFNVGIDVIDFSVADKLQGWTGGKSATDILDRATMLDRRHDHVCCDKVAPHKLPVASLNPGCAGRWRNTARLNRERLPRWAWQNCYLSFWVDGSWSSD